MSVIMYRFYVMLIKIILSKHGTLKRAMSELKQISQPTGLVQVLSRSYIGLQPEMLHRYNCQKELSDFHGRGVCWVRFAFPTVTFHLFPAYMNCLLRRMI